MCMRAIVLKIISFLRCTMVTYLPCQREMLRGGGWSSVWQGWTLLTMIIFDNRYNNDDDYSDDGDDYGGLGHRNLDPTRHTNSDALKAHIITFEVTNTSLIAHFFRSLAHVTILDCCWKWDISLQTLLEEEEDQLKGFFIFRKTFKTTLALHVTPRQVSRTSLTAAVFLSLISPSGVRPRFLLNFETLETSELELASFGHIDEMKYTNRIKWFYNLK